MSAAAWLQLAVFLVLLLALAWPVSKLIAYVMDGKFALGSRIESPLYALAGVRADAEMGWIKRRDLRTVLAWSALSEQFTLAFEYLHDRRQFNVIFNHEAGALEASPVKGIPAVSEDDYYNVTLRFTEVGS